jgi:hypothetical protein
LELRVLMPTAVVALSESWTAFSLPKIKVLDSNSTPGINVCASLFRILLALVYVAALRRADPPSKEPYRLRIELQNWESSQGQPRAVEQMRHFNIISLPTASV